MSRKCVISRCEEPAASELLPDLVDPNGIPCHYTRCVGHQLDLYRTQIAALTYHDSQLTMAAITAGIPMGVPS